jgi:transposase
LQKDYITELLKLEGLSYWKYEETDSTIELYLKREDKRPECPSCQSKMYINGYRTHKVKDIPMQGKTLILHIKKQHYRCKCCGKTQVGKLSFIKHKKQHTERLALHVLKNMKNRNFKTCSEDIGVSSPTVMRWFNEKVPLTEPTIMPNVIHIDEFKGNSGDSKYQLAITNGETHEIFDILPNREKTTVQQYFERFEKAPSIIVMDMWRPFRNASQEVFSNAIIVVDRFHYVKQIGEAFRKVRCRIQAHLDEGKRIKKYWKLLHKNYYKLSESQLNRLQELLGYSDELSEVYEYKKMMDEVNLQRGEKAQKLFDILLNSLKISNLPEVKVVYKTYTNWYKEIINSFYYTSFTY